MSRKSTTEPLCYRVGNTDRELVVCPAVLQHFLKHQQKSFSATEVGGQLFAEFQQRRICLSVATGPTSEDKRGRFWFVPNQKRQNAEIQNLFKRGLHFVGDWHTHPEATPSPSSTDLNSMQDCFKKSRHQLKSFVMIIVGQAEFPDGLWVSLHTEKRSQRLEPVPATGITCCNVHNPLHLSLEYPK